MPVEDRAADVWEALVMVADAAGGNWPATARTAAIVLTSSDPHASMGINLLRDVQTVFGSEDKMRSEDVVAHLLALPDSLWLDFHYNSTTSFNVRDLSRLLKKYDVQSRDVWIDQRAAKGYVADDLRDAWERYVHPFVGREVGEIREAQGSSRS
jgi:hypothetical protein